MLKFLYTKAALTGPPRVFFATLVLFALNSSGIPQKKIDITEVRQIDYKQDVPFEPSAVEPIPGSNLLLVANDKRPDLVLVDSEKGEIVGKVPIPNLEISSTKDWEGMAMDGDNRYYLISSDGVLVRFELTDSKPPTIPKESKREWDLRGVLQHVGAYPAINVEGLTVRESGSRKELILGLREFRNTVRVYTIDLTKFSQAVSETDLILLFEFESTPVNNTPSQLTSIEFIRSWNAFLILTSAEEERKALPSHGSKMWLLFDTEIPTSKPATPGAAINVRVTPSEINPNSLTSWKERKAEGLCILSESSSPYIVKIAIVFDNDFQRVERLNPNNGIPSALQFLTVTHSPKQ